MNIPIKVSALLLGELGQAIHKLMLLKGIPISIELFSDKQSTRYTPMEEDHTAGNSAEEVLFLIADMDALSPKKLNEVLGNEQRPEERFTIVVTVESNDNDIHKDTLKKQRQILGIVDSLIVLPSLSKSQASTNPALLEAIYKVITHLTGLIQDSYKAEVSVDFEDVKTVLQGAGSSVVGIGNASGENRAMKAANQAMSYPFLRKEQLANSTRVLLNIFSGTNTELEMDELIEITDAIQEACGDTCEIIFGHGLVESLDQDIEVFLLATH